MIVALAASAFSTWLDKPRKPTRPKQKRTSKLGRRPPRPYKLQHPESAAAEPANSHPSATIKVVTAPYITNQESLLDP